MKRIVEHLLSIIGAILTIIAFVSLLASRTLRTWTRENSTWVYVGLVIVTLVAVATLDYSISLYRRYRGLKASLKGASDHDKRLLREILRQIPLDGDVVRWFKHAFFVKSIPFERLKALREVYDTLTLHLLGFNNQQVDEAYQSFITAIEEFDATVVQLTMFEDDSYRTVHVPLTMKEGKGGEGRYYAALEEIQVVVGKLVAAYDDFLVACQLNGLNIYKPELSV